MPRANPGEVWIVDLGLAAKVRPFLVLGDYPEDDELALVIIVPHTTAVRNNRWEVPTPSRFSRPGCSIFSSSSRYRSPVCEGRSGN